MPSELPLPAAAVAAVPQRASVVIPSLSRHSRINSSGLPNKPGASLESNRNRASVMAPARMIGKWTSLPADVALLTTTLPPCAGLGAKIASSQMRPFVDELARCIQRAVLK